MKCPNLKFLLTQLYSELAGPVQIAHRSYSIPTCPKQFLGYKKGAIPLLPSMKPKSLVKPKSLASSLAAFNIEVLN